MFEISPPSTRRIPTFVEADVQARFQAKRDLALYPSQAPLSLNVVVVGCGLGGLAAAFCLTKAGHKVTIVETAPAIGEVGAGIQVTPNVSRLLIRWGLGEVLDKVAVRPEAIVFRRWQNGEKVGYVPWGETMAQDHGAPYYHIHRADFHRMLYDLTVPLITLRLGSTVVNLDASSESPSVTLASGEVLKADLIIGADGVKSLLREHVVGAVDKPVPTGDAAYRVIIPTEEMMKHPELVPFVENPEMTGWMGPGRHVMAYCIRGKKEYNLVLLHPDDGSVESWTAEGSADKMRADFEGWDPRIQTMLSMVPSVLKWKLMDRLPLDTWIHKNGRVVLLGDSCHPMLPYRAQGAAMAIEDAAVLGSLFSHLSHPSQITPLLRAYEQLRLPRTAATQASARLNQHIFHLPDGPEQRQRDAEMIQAMEMWAKTSSSVDANGVDATEGNPNQWADKKKNKEQFDYDADAAAEKWWNTVGVKEVAPLAETFRPRL